MTTPSGTARNIAAVQSLYDRYRDAWQSHWIPTPEKGMLVWAPGAVIENGPHFTEITGSRDFAAEPTFMNIEAQYFWVGIPDFRVTELHVSGSGDEVMAFVQYSGTSCDGTVLAPIWTADRWVFDERGRITRWLQVTDLGAWAAWQALNTETDYLSHVTAAFTAAGVEPRFAP
ncbi:nuclear transport factor 2 family protein [Mycolicibacterium setense]|uniref:nuclear transport factor 2 family protein n=1 Tax=Mycolicibacterium setense TaxID=431269 RepID=UPI00057357D4|nr:nuclear transport factor 2 family protein [Mycolicibacterium setense]KHO24930.1 hypothetical protein QQ25_04180 [Mycolicibacterium setense]MCV7109811.1 hypothetical protein [Mycolicibacterium setense]